MDKYYSVLGVSPSATLEEIVKAYRKRLKVVHPDRFDARTQPDEWSQANKMLQELNEAYDWIKKNHSYDNPTADKEKTAYKKTRNESTSSKSTDHKESDGYRRSEPYSKGITRTSILNLTNTHVHFINTLFKDRNNLKILTPNLYIKSTFFIVSSGVICLMLSIFVSSNSLAKDDFSFYVIIILIATIFATKNGVFTYKYVRSRVKPCVLFTPMYFIHIDFNEVVFGYEWEIDLIKFHREQGKFPYVNLRLGEYFTSFSAPLLGYRFFRKKFEKIDNIRANVTDRAEWFTQNDILRNIKSSPKVEVKKSVKNLYPYAASISTALVASIIFSNTITPESVTRFC